MVAGSATPSPECRPSAEGPARAAQPTPVPGPSPGQQAKEGGKSRAPLSFPSALSLVLCKDSGPYLSFNEIEFLPQ